MCQKIIAVLKQPKRLVAKLNRVEIKEQPELEDLTVTPATQEQKFKSNMYGYNEVTVKRVEADDLNIVPSIEEQIFTGLYKDVNVNKITSDLIPNLTPEIIAKGREILGLVGTYEGNLFNLRSITKNVYYDDTGKHSFKQSFSQTFIVKEGEEFLFTITNNHSSSVRTYSFGFNNSMEYLYFDDWGANIASGTINRERTLTIPAGVTLLTISILDVDPDVVDILSAFKIELKQI